MVTSTGRVMFDNAEHEDHRERNDFPWKGPGPPQPEAAQKDTAWQRQGTDEEKLCSGEGGSRNLLEHLLGGFCRARVCAVASGTESNESEECALSPSSVELLVETTGVVHRSSQ